MIAVNRRMDKQPVIYYYKGIGLAKGGNELARTCDRIDILQRHYAEPKKPDSDKHMLWGLIYVKL